MIYHHQNHRDVQYKTEEGGTYGAGEVLSTQTNVAPVTRLPVDSAGIQMAHIQINYEIHDCRNME